MNSNPELQVKITLTGRELQTHLPLLLLMQAARVVEHTEQYGTFLLHAPKHTTSYAFWAEGVLNKAQELSIPALIVRQPQFVTVTCDKPRTLIAACADCGAHNCICPREVA